MTITRTNQGQPIQPSQAGPSDTVTISGRDWDKLMTYLTCARNMAEIGSTLSQELRNLERWAEPSRGR